MSSRGVVRGIGFFFVGCLLGFGVTLQIGPVVFCTLVATVLLFIAAEMDDEH